MVNSICSAAFCESAALRGYPSVLAGEFLIASDILVIGLTACALSVKPCRACQLSQRESQEHCRKPPHYA